MPQINADGVKRNFYPGDKLPLWHEELEPQSSLLDILAAGNPDPMVQWICSPASHSPLWNFLLYDLFKILSGEFEIVPAGTPKCLFSSYYYHALVNSCSADCDRCSELRLVIRVKWLAVYCDENTALWSAQRSYKVMRNCIWLYGCCVWAYWYAVSVMPSPLAVIWWGAFWLNMTLKIWKSLSGAGQLCWVCSCSVSARPE